MNLPLFPKLTLWRADPGWKISVLIRVHPWLKTSFVLFRSTEDGATQPASGRQEVWSSAFARPLGTG